jgi:hypothetical protein
MEIFLALFFTNGLFVEIIIDAYKVTRMNLNDSIAGKRALKSLRCNVAKVDSLARKLSILSTLVTKNIYLMCAQ